MKNTTICIFFRKDNYERQKNLSIITDFYSTRTNIPIIVFYEYTEIIDTQIISDLIRKNTTVILHKGHKGYWNKCAGYNKCALVANTPILCFNDVDTIVNPEQIYSAAEYLTDNKDSGIIFPFDGRFLCVDKKLKEEFFMHKNFENLQQYDPDKFPNSHVHCVNRDSPGGVAMMRKDNFIGAGGYNPKFHGWGYEDSEIVSRFKILKYKNGRIQTGPVWHFDHTDQDSAKRDHNPFLEDNRKECSSVEAMNTSQLRDYIKTWTL